MGAPSLSSSSDAPELSCWPLCLFLEKEKEISKSYSVMGRNPAHPGASPADPLSFSFPRATQLRPSGLAGLPTPFSLAAQCGSVACRSRAGHVFLAETW
jgi:hypothetical protein